MAFDSDLLQLVLSVFLDGDVETCTKDLSSLLPEAVGSKHYTMPLWRTIEGWGNFRLAFEQNFVPNLPICSQYQK